VCSSDLDLTADAIVLVNLRNAPHFPARIPDATINAALDTGRATIFEQAWVDVCEFNLPCLGDRSSCRSDCDRSFADRLYSRAHAAIFNAPMHRDAIANVIGVPLPQHRILSPPTVDVTRFRDLGLKRDIDVLYVGTISAYKGYYELIERFGPQRMTFAGPNALDHDVEGTYLGQVDYADVPELMNRAQTFAHLPRWLEPMGRTPVEAALCGCEVVLNDHVGVASYPRKLWTDPDEIRQAPDRFWNHFEEVYA
jgi:glycosyltransferase involved in cell wall biosynthesis